MNVVTAARPELDRRVKASLAPGYAKGDKVLIPEHVTVYRFQKPADVDRILRRPAPSRRRTAETQPAYNR